MLHEKNQQGGEWKAEPKASCSSALYSKIRNWTILMSLTGQPKQIPKIMTPFHYVVQLGNLNSLT